MLAVLINFCFKFVVTGPLAEKQIAYVCGETLKVGYI